ncbi:hypothetical protein F5Y09DRAFT_297835 [Xylaria sp. FL1042]|nr:hypothetical protein F5Y09DRAFT_297835 [Xylaria sp. FL1042]
MEAVGTAAALTELLSLSVKVSKAAKGLVGSFINAPEELVQLVTKLGHLQSRIEQLHGLSQDLNAADLAVLLTPEHQTVLSAGLQANFQALQIVQSLCNARSGKPQSVGARWRWAMFDKKKASRILENIAKAESDLSVMLAILGVRLTTLSQVSLGALNVSHALLHAGLKESTEAVKELIHAEIQGLIRAGSANSVETTTIVSEDGLQQIVNSMNTRCLGPETKGQSRRPENKRGAGRLEEASEHTADRYERRKQPKPIAREFSSLGDEDDDQIDPGVRFLKHHTRKSLTQHSITFGSLRKSCTANKPAIGALLTAQSKRKSQKLRVVLEFGFNLFCQHVLQFELNLRQVARGWASMPRLNCSMTVFNVRPTDAPIFQACRDGDIGKVKFLLESGEASVYDADDRIGGLLEHVVHGDYEKYWYISNSKKLFQIKQLVEHLLDQGCDPNAFYGPIRGNRLPAVLFAFDRGYPSTVSAMLSRGADIISFGSILAGRFMNVNAAFPWKIKLLRSMGYSDWKSESYLESDLPHTILHGACEVADLQEVLFALEIVGLAPNLKGAYNQAPLWSAAVANFLRGAAILFEYGAAVDPSEPVHSGTPLIRCLRHSLWSANMAHYLLLHGADPRLKGDLEGSAWHQIWEVACNKFGRRSNTWSFMSLEGVLAHLLIHGSDPFELFSWADAIVKTYSSYHFYPSRLHLQAPEIARFWSYDIRCKPAYLAPPEEWISSFEKAEQTRTPRFTFRWSRSGLIYQGLSEQDGGSLQDTEAGETLPSTVECDEQNPVCRGPNNTTDHVPESPAEHSANCSDTDSQSSSDRLEDHDNEDTFFRRQTQFYHHISSAKGCRQLTRFPMVLALCDALQYAGYRAEMDDDGDIWYEIEDGDRYFDAQENHLAEVRENYTAEFCPICRDFEGHGLGHILREVEEAKREIWEYREKVKNSRHYFQ